MKKMVIGILAHVDAGKTTLSEGLLYTGGSIRKMGRVDNQDAFLDTHALERERGITIFSKQAVIQGTDLEITLLDTPGHVDFSAEMERTLQVLDAAVLVISAADGIQGHTLTLWRLLRKYGLPVFIFINKMDQEGSDQEQQLTLLKTRLSGECVDFTDVTSGEFHESVAMCDEALLNAFLEKGKTEETAIREAIRARKLFPCLFGSALKYQGVRELLDTLEKFAPLPVYPEQFGAKVYKIGRDEQGIRLTFLKVTGGGLRVKDVLSLQNRETGEVCQEKVNQIRIYSGTKYETVNEAEAGTVCAVTGLSATKPGEGIGREKDSMMPVLEPVLTYRMELQEGTDPAAMLPKLRLLEEEEPQLHIVWEEALQELRVQLMGEVQIEILKRLIEERFGVAVTFGTGTIVYRETITDMVEGVGHFEPLRHYAEVHLLLEPLEAGSGLVFAADCSEDLLARNWQRLVLTHLEEKEHKGVLTGSPITDMKITLIGGKAHVKHTEGGDFRQATYRAVRQGLMQVHSVLLEPFYEFRLELPQSAVGRAMMDIEQMSGTIRLENSEHQDTLPTGESMAVLTGSAPVACMQDYATKVAAYGMGHGRLICSLLGYRPCHNTEEVMEQLAYNPEADTGNSADSVFCMHGVGSVISWNEVAEYMHIQSGLADRFPERAPGRWGRSTEEESEGIRPVRRTREVLDDFIDIEEIDRILTRTFHANKKPDFIPHKGISGRRRQERPVPASVTTYHPQVKKEKFLLVDGYNVIFAWKELKELAADNIDAARGQLQDILCNYQAICHENLILVFDAYKIEGHGTEYLDYHNIHLVYTREAETADQYIEHFAHENGRKYDVTVVTSDGLEQIIIRGQGCRLISSREFETVVEEALQQFRREYLEKLSGESTKNYLFDTVPKEEISQIKRNTEELSDSDDTADPDDI